MRWNEHEREDPLTSAKYIEVLRQTAAAVLGQESAADAAGVLKAPYFVQWAIESNSGGGYKPEKKFTRSTYELVAGPHGLTSRCRPDESAHVEHVWTIEKTKLLLVEAYTQAQAAMASGRLTRTQCVEALMTIIEARRHTVLMPASLMTHEQFKHSKALDGFTARYGTCMVIRRGGVKIDFEEEDRTMQTIVDDAFEYLRGGSGAHSWPWLGRSVAVVSKPYGTIAQPKTSNAATTLQRVSWSDFDLALSQLGHDSLKPTSSNKRDSGWAPFFQSVPHRAGVQLPRGDFTTADGRVLKIAKVDREEFMREIDAHVQQARRMVY